jgi:hypothetical protein
LEDGSISITSLVVASSIKQVVDASPSEVPVSDMSLVIDFLEDIFNGLVEVANVHGNEEVLVILAVEDTLDGLIHGGIQSNDFSEIDVNVGVVSSNESTSEVVESLEVLEIGLSSDVIPARDGVGLGKIEISPDSIVIIIEIKDCSVDGEGNSLRFRSF